MENMAERLLRSFAGEVNKYPRAYTFYLVALDQYLAPKCKIVIAGRSDSHIAWEMLSAAGRSFMPWTSVAFNNLDNTEAIASIMPEVAAQKTSEEAAAFICENFTCLSPIKDVREFEAHLRNIRG